MEEKSTIHKKCLPTHLHFGWLAFKYDSAVNHISLYAWKCLWISGHLLSYFLPDSLQQVHTRVCTDAQSWGIRWHSLPLLGAQRLVPVSGSSLVTSDLLLLTQLCSNKEKSWAWLGAGTRWDGEFLMKVARPLPQVQFSSVAVQLLSRVWLFATRWTAARQASLCFTISQSLLRLMESMRSPTISSSVDPFSSCPQSFPASGFFPMSWPFTSGGQRIGASASASVLPMNVQGWYPLGWAVFIFLQSKGLSRVFSSINSLALSLLYGPTLKSVHDFWKNHVHTYDYLIALLRR